MQGTTLKGKTALVTGSTSGIGLGIAKALAAQGANVVFNGFGDTSEIEALKAGIAQEYGVLTAYHNADMSKSIEIEAMMRFAAERFNGIDILVNNAGIQHVASIEEFPVEKWDAIIAINMSSSFHTTAAALPMMRKAGWGRIVNIASAHGLTASPFKSAYVAAKHGVIGLTKVTGLETAQENITCNAICPGYVLTPLVEAQIPDTMKEYGMTRDEVIQKVMLERQPSKEFVTVEQLGDTAVFLCSDAAAQITATSVSVDGGWTAL